MMQYILHYYDDSNVRYIVVLSLIAQPKAQAVGISRYSIDPLILNTSVVLSNLAPLMPPRSHNVEEFMLIALKEDRLLVINVVRISFFISMLHSATAVLL